MGIFRALMGAIGCIELILLVSKWLHGSLFSSQACVVQPSTDCCTRIVTSVAMETVV